jgi:SAM-dependent methyltransferase
MRFTDTVILHQYYLDRASELVEKYKAKIILKTDLDNEVYSSPIEGGIVGNLGRDLDITAFDILPDLYERAKKLNLKANLGVGDIREIKDVEKYDMIIDLSTLDHVNQSDAIKTIGNYKRALKKGGILLLIVWTAEQYREADKQYFFKDIDQHLFNIISQKDDLYQVGDDILKEYVCKK